jgi:hypothetical protein
MVLTHKSYESYRSHPAAEPNVRADADVPCRPFAVSPCRLFAH